MELLEHLWQQYEEQIHREVEQSYSHPNIVRVGKEIINMDIKDRIERGGVFAFISFVKKYLNSLQFQKIKLSDKIEVFIGMKDELVR